MPHSDVCCPSIEMASFGQPRSERSIRLAVVADPHLAVDGSEYDKLYRSTEMFERVIADVNDRDVAYLLTLGDLTREGVAAEFDEFDDALAGLEVPHVAIPGNHDVPKAFDSHPGISLEGFCARYTTDRVPFRVDLGDVHLLGLDSASDDVVADSHDGYIPDAQLSWLEDALVDVDDAVVALHHNLPGAVTQYEAFTRNVDGSIRSPPVLRQPDEFVDVLAREEVRLVVSGHMHVPGVSRTAGVREVLAPSSSSFPLAYLLFEIGPNGTEVRYVSIGNAGESTTAYHQRCRLNRKNRALAGLAATRLASFPLVAER